MLNANGSLAPAINEQLNGIVKTFHQHPVTTSRKVATVFEKRHDHVLRDIKNLFEQVFNAPKFGEVDSSNFLSENFFRITYKDKKGEQRTEYKLTKDAFLLLVMGYNGAKAIAFKVAYIQRFNEMEAALKAREHNAVLQAQDFVKLTGNNADFDAIMRVVPAITDDYSRVCYHYLLGLEKLGFSTRSGQVWRRVRRNPHYFVRVENSDYVAHDFLYNMFLGRIKAHNDKVFRSSMQPELPFNQNGSNHILSPLNPAL